MGCEKWPKKPLLLIFEGVFSIPKELVEQIETLVVPSLAKENIELVDLTYQKEMSGWTLRFFLDKPGGITLDDCETWSRKLGDLLDQSDLLQQSYVLEVSSPGLDRPLKKGTDFQRFKGERVHIKLYAAINGQKNFHGQLIGLEGESVLLRLEDQREIGLPLTQIAKAKLDPIIKF